MLRMVPALATLSLVLGTLPVRAGAPEPRTEDEHIFYTLGVALSQGLEGYHMSQRELALVQAGLADGVLKGKQIEQRLYQAKFDGLRRTRAAAAAADERKAGERFLAKAASQRGIKQTNTGIVIRELALGHGDSPTAHGAVKVRYEGKLRDGTVFDSAKGEKGERTLALQQTIKCWQEALPLMKEGERSEILCPPDLAYGDIGKPPRIKPGAVLVFDIELVDVVK